MRHSYFLIAPLLLLGAICKSILPARSAGGQDDNGKDSRSWTTSPFDQKVFIENKGQFDGSPVREQVLYGIQNAGETILFTSKGVIFVYNESEDYPKEKDPLTTEPPLQYKERHGEKEKSQSKLCLISMQWLGANQEMQVYAENPVPDFYSYFHPSSKYSVLRCTAYKKIIYKNLYPGVDVEYSFHQEQGMKYALILHPGADPSAIKMVYSGSKKIEHDEKGNMRIKCPEGEIIDHAPETFYQSDKAAVESSFLLDGNVVMFLMEKYDPSRTVIIDPWTISPGFITVNRGYDLARNPTTGEIFVYGGSPPYQLKKLDALGNVLWTYTANSIYSSGSTYYGDMAIDPAGDVYLSALSSNNVSAMKINGATTSLIWTIGNCFEPWRLQYDLANNRIIVGGIVNKSSDNIAAYNLTNGVLMNSATIVAPASNAEIRSFAVAPNGNIYALHVSQYGTTSAATNRLTANTSAFATIYNLQSGYTLGEAGAYYATNENNILLLPESVHGFNGITTDANYVYTYDGAVIYKRNITNGNAVGNVPVTGGITEKNSGIVMDSCGNIYVGTQNEIRQYDSMLVFVSSVSVPGAVYDLALGGTAVEILACGNGFVASVNFSCNTILAVTAIASSPLCNGQCTGTATVTPTNGTSPYTYSWSNTQSTSAITGLCAQTYSVLVTDASGTTATAIVTITQPTAITTSTTATPAACGSNNGIATVVTSGGTPSYTYLWSNGNTTSSSWQLAVGSYSVLVTDANNCTQTATVAVTQTGGPTAVVGTTATILSGNSTSLNASGGITYSWSPSTGLNCTTCANPIASTTATTEYCVYVFDTAGCFDSACVTVYVIEPLDCLGSAERELYLPNTFSPNGDNENDMLKIYYGDIRCIETFKMIIFDRWGEKVFETTNATFQWDGAFKGKIMNTAVFVYYLEATFQNGNEIVRKGNVSLIK